MSSLLTGPATRGRVGPFQVLAPPYESRFGTVYRCRDTGIDREVAVKTLPRDPADRRMAQARLHREARLRAILDHPNIMPLNRLVRSRDGLLLVGPWLTGGTLHDRLRGPLTSADTLALADGIGRALDRLHHSGWWHGDVSAHNVLYAPSHSPDEPDRPVLADFGTARRTGTRGVEDGELVATAAVTAPELCAGAVGDGRSDLYSLGVLIYAALTGAYPFDVPDRRALLAMHERAPVPMPSERSVLVGPATEAMLLRALAKSPAARFPSGAMLAQALRAALSEDGVGSPSATARQRSRRTAAPAIDSSAPAFINTAAVESLGERLERFAATLNERDRAALSVVLERARLSGARANAELTGLAMQVFGPPAALLALEESGAMDALADAPRTATEVASVCGAPVWTLAPLLETLATAGLLGRERDRFVLPPGPAQVYCSLRAAGVAAQPLREAFEYWSHLPRWAATGEPLQQMDNEDGSVYRRLVGSLGALNSAAAQQLAIALRRAGYVVPGAAVLDVGAGSAVWGIAIVAGDPEATLTAVDRPLVLETARVYAQAAGIVDRLGTIAGDWREVPLPEGTFDIALLANVCHLHDGPEVLALLSRVRAALRPEGSIVIVDAIPELMATASLTELLYGLGLALRTPRGRIHDRASYAVWLRQAGFTNPERLTMITGSRLTTLVARAER